MQRSLMTGCMAGKVHAFAGRYGLDECDVQRGFRIGRFFA